MRMEAGFVFLDEVLSGVRWDAKYATWDNFTSTPVDGYEVNRIVGSDALADALMEAKEQAAALGFGLLLWDAYRPQRAVNRFLEWSGQPEDGRVVLNEVNTLPGFTAYSRYPRMMAAAGMSLSEVIDRCISSSMAP